MTRDREAPSWSSIAVASGLLAVLAFAAFGLWPPSYRLYRSMALEAPFEPLADNIYHAAVSGDWPHDNKGAESNSRLEVFEDGQLLGPAHASVTEMESPPGGAYAHQRFGLWLTASDHSDPNVNGRSYSVRQPRGLPRVLHLAAVLGMHFLASFLVWGVLRRIAAGGRWGAAVQVAAQAVLVLATLQLAAWCLLENELVSAGKVEEELYRAAFRDGPEAEGLLEYNFEAHHYLSYALNGRKTVDGKAVHEGLYRLRRQQPLMPREDVDLRIVVMGGSTTYDVALRNEEDTWVHRLETGLRELYGEKVEVLNAGAGGYTLLEHTVHYLTLLTHLEPDLVILFTGHNDVHPRLYEALRPDYSNYRVPWAGEGEIPRPIPALEAVYFYRLAYLRGTLRPALRRPLGDVSRNPNGPNGDWEKQLARNGREIYETALENLVLLIRAQGREVAILPQYLSPRTARDETFGRGIAEHNEIGRKIAEAHGLLFVESILEPGAFDRWDTVDRCHFSDRGARKMAALVQEALIAEELPETLLSRRSGSRRGLGPGTPR